MLVGFNGSCLFPSLMGKTVKSLSGNLPWTFPSQQSYALFLRAVLLFFTVFGHLFALSPLGELLMKSDHRSGVRTSGCRLPLVFFLSPQRDIADLSFWAWLGSYAASRGCMLCSMQRLMHVKALPTPNKAWGRPLPAQAMKLPDISRDPTAESKCNPSFLE